MNKFQTAIAALRECVASLDSISIDDDENKDRIILQDLLRDVVRDLDGPSDDVPNG